MLKLSGEGMHNVTSFGLRPSDVKDNFLNQLKQQACQPKMMPNKFVKIHGRMDLEAHNGP